MLSFFSKLISSQQLAINTKHITIIQKDMEILRDLIHTLDPENPVGKLTEETAARIDYTAIVWHRPKQEGHTSPSAQILKIETAQRTAISWEPFAQLPP